MTAAASDSGFQLYSVQGLRNITSHEAWRAALFVAEKNEDRGDRRLFLDMLGLGADQVYAGRRAARKAGTP